MAGKTTDTETLDDLQRVSNRLSEYDREGLEGSTKSLIESYVLGARVRILVGGDAYEYYEKLKEKLGK